MKSRNRQIIIGISLAFGLALILGAIKFLQISKAIKEHSNFQPPPEAVTVLRVVRQPWRSQIQTTGDVVPVQGVTLANEVPGTVVSIGFESGTTVKAGSALIELNSSEEAAELRAAEATRERARAILARISSLEKKSASSKDDLEAAQSQVMIAQAKVESINAQIQKKRIVAPFDGLVGVRRVNLGQYIAPGTPIVSIHSLDKLRINFRLPQQFFSLVNPGQEVKVALSAPSQNLDTAQPGGSKQNGRGSSIEGLITARITAKEPAIDPTNRNFLIQATVDSSGESNGSTLRAGMFVNVEIELDDSQSVVAVPVSSVVHAPYGDSVFIVERVSGQAIANVKQQMVTLGSRRGELVAVVSGLKGDEEIVSGGVFKLRPNVPVLVSEESLPTSGDKSALPDT